MSQLLGKNELQQIGAGIWPDFKNDSAPMLVDSSNVVYEGGRALPAPGQKLILSTGLNVTPVAIHTQFAYGQTRIFIASSKGIHEWTGTQLLRRWAEPVTKGQFASFGNFTLFADGGKLLARSTEGSDFLRVDDSPNLDFVTVFSPYVLGFGARTLFWCARDDIQTWTTSEDNDARRLPVRDMDDDATCVIAHSNGNYILTPNGLWYSSYVGGTLYFGVRKLLKDIGAVGRNAAWLVGNILIGRGASGIWQSDGVTFNYIDSPIIREDLDKSMNQAQISRMTVWHDTANSRVVFSYINQEGKWKAFARSLTESNWAKLEAGYPCVDRAGATPLTYVASTQGNIYGQTNGIVPLNQVGSMGLRLATRLEIGLGYGHGTYGQFGYGGVLITSGESGLKSQPDVLFTFTSENSTFEFTGLSDTSGNVWFETKDMDFGTTEEKYIDEIVIKIANAGTAGDLQLRYAIKDRMNDPTVWSDFISLEGADAPVFIRATARYWKFRIDDNFVRDRWQLTGIEYYGEVMGGRRTYGS